MKHDIPTAARTAEPVMLGRLADATDQTFQGWLARCTMGLSPAGLTNAYAAWVAQMVLCPGRMTELLMFPLVHAGDAYHMGRARDSRFTSSLWQNWPWQQYVQGFRMAEAFWDRATLNVPGLSAADTRVVNFSAHQILNALSPANFFATNPEIQAAARASGGRTLVDGTLRAIEDWQRQAAGQPPVWTESFTPGKQVAITPGKVIFRNNLIELIQYAPATKTVQREPVMILPAWIMKYYILDLSPENSLVRWLVAQGHTVFMVSWKNPTEADRDLGLDDYIRKGALAALDAVSAIIPDTKIHLAGYCLGGTLAMIFAAWLARRKDERLQTLSLFAAQGDFSEAGEITVFVTASEVAYLKAMMHTQGYLDTRQMAGAFQMLRSTDSIWSHLVRDYWLGEPPATFDLLAWNADATRMPSRMHSQYLERLFLENQFADGHFTVEGQTIAAESITIPVFAVGTENDHVAPWKSVYKVHLMVSGEVTFVLTSGGHNAGIVSEPGHPGRHYHLATRRAAETYLSAEAWHAAAPEKDGSWWQAWDSWLKDHGPGGKTPAPAMGSSRFLPLEDAPGTYVHQR